MTVPVTPEYKSVSKDSQILLCLEHLEFSPTSQRF